VSWRDALQAGAELTLGAGCPGCHRAGLGLCSRCLAVIGKQRPFAVGGLTGLPPVYAGGAYAGVLKDVLIAAKERSALGLFPVLAERLALTIAALLVAHPAVPVELVNVPTLRSRSAERGVDHARELARMAARRLRRLGVRITASPLLVVQRRPQDQAGLARDQRWLNLNGAFRAAHSPMAAVIILDDIVTTGATLAEATRAIVAAGGTVAGCVAVAATAKGGPC
jgi:Predicted amidophosphoribosyltransferases